MQGCGKRFVTITRLLLNQVFELAVTRRSAAETTRRLEVTAWTFICGFSLPSHLHCTQTSQLPAFLTEVN